MSEKKDETTDRTIKTGTWPVVKCVTGELGLAADGTAETFEKDGVPVIEGATENAVR